MTHYTISLRLWLLTALSPLCLLACSAEKKADQTARQAPDVSYEQVANESAAVLEQLNKAAAEINAASPVQITETTRLDSAQVLSQSVLQFNYTLTSVTRDRIDLARLEATTKPSLIESVRTNTAMAELRDHGITMVYNYRDRSGVYLLKIPITPADYAR